jgi:phosphatidylserine/phosphatidylglycerophosphate/cardiolipin synthase-like enzyme
MAEFLTTKGTANWIENIIIEAKNKLILVTPYLQLSPTFFERLKDASNRAVKVTIIFGKDDLKPNDKNSLAELDNIELYFYENLHAKCYFNEIKMVITSMNMYEFSEINNREMGVLIDYAEDTDLFNKGIAETLSIKNNSEIYLITKTDRTFLKKKLIQNGEKQQFLFEKSKSPTRGYCIRCQARIPFNREKPYCISCFTIWAQFENPDYEENVCHCCGEFKLTTMSKPLCYNCYKADV